MTAEPPSTSGPNPDQAVAALAARLARPVVLVGMMGVGKTSVGRRLAAALGVPFVDADDAIEEAAQMTIAEIFDQFGEPSFRDGERRVIARLLSDNGAAAEPATKVISTGGGAFCNAETRALILARGIAVWLDAEVDTLVERTARKGHRPLLRQGDPREVLARLRDERAPVYAQAPIHVKSTPGPHSRTLRTVIEALNHHLAQAQMSLAPDQAEAGEREGPAAA
jgi:shikimate kinase